MSGWFDLNQLDSEMRIMQRRGGTHLTGQTNLVVGLAAVSSRPLAVGGEQLFNLVH
jgi:hypothetical protein